jgi:HEAT repeat protein
LQALNAALKDCDDSVRYAAAKALGDMGDSRAIEPLAIDLQTEKNCSAAIALSKIRDPQAIRKLISAEAVAKGHPEQCIRKALRKIEKNPYMVEPLILLLDDESKKVRYWAISALGLIRDSRAVDALIASIKKEKRGPAVWALGNIGDVRAVEPLIDILDDKSSHVRYSAAKALGRLEDPRAVESLIRSLRDSSSNLRVRSNAVEALGKIGGRRAREVLIDLLGPDRIGILAACALGELKDEQALEPLITALEDPNKWHRMWAAEALGNLNDRRAASALISVLKHDTDTIVRMKSVQALGKIKDKSAFKPLTEVVKKRSS